MLDKHDCEDCWMANVCTDSWVDWFLGKNIGEFCCFENVDLRFLLGSCCSVGSGR